MDVIKQINIKPLIIPMVNAMNCDNFKQLSIHDLKKEIQVAIIETKYSNTNSMKPQA